MLCARCKKRPQLPGLRRCEHCQQVVRNKRNRAKLKKKHRRKEERHNQPQQQRQDRLPHKSVRKLQRRLKWAAIEAYGGPECTCCGVDVFEFLTIDYTDNVRHSERQPITDLIYYWLQEQSYPSGFQVLCCNCSTGKRLNGGVCPHKLIPGSVPDKHPRAVTKPPD